MKFKNYPEEAMHQAIEAVKKGMPKATASKKFGVPRITLTYKVSGRLPEVCRMGPSTVLTLEEETRLEKWVLDIARAGFPITKLMLLDTVAKLLLELKRPNPFNDGRPGRKWYTSFLKRHPKISERTPEHLTGARTTVSEVNIRRWFAEVKDYLVTFGYEDILKDPKRIFNADETAFYFCPKSGKVLGPKGEKNVYNASKVSEKENETVLITVSAAGTQAPPTIIFPYKRLPADVIASVPAGWGIGKTDLGWMTGEAFYEYMANVFQPWLVKQDITLPIIFFVDGHNSHLTMHLSDLLRDKQIILVALFPNSTHILQPLDVAVFRPLKEGWRSIVKTWAKDNPGETISKKNFVPILKETIDKKLTVSSVQNGFRVCGLYPFDADKVDYTKCIIAYVNKDNQQAEVPALPAVPEVTANSISLKAHLTFLETQISEELLKEFKEQENDRWEGEDSAKELFRVWQKIKLMTKAEELGLGAVEQQNLIKTPSVDKSSHCTAVKSATTTQKCVDRNQQGADEGENSPFIDASQSSTETGVNTQLHNLSSTHLADDLLAQPSTSGIQNNTNMTPQTKAAPNEGNSLGLPEISPFKRVLFWPENSNSKRKKKQDKIPAVVTSDEWKKYHEKKKQEKDQKEKEKEERKKQRADKALEKQRQAEEKKKAKASKSAVGLGQNKTKKQAKKKISAVNKKGEERESWVCFGCNMAWKDLSPLEKRCVWLVCDQCHRAAHKVCIRKQHLNLLESETSSDSDAPFICEDCYDLSDSYDNDSTESDNEWA